MIDRALPPLEEMALCCTVGVNEVPAARMSYDWGGGLPLVCALHTSPRPPAAVPGETMNPKGDRGGGQMVTGLRL